MELINVCVRTGKAGTPSFSMRYNAEDDELEHLVDEPPSSEDASTGNAYLYILDINTCNKL